MKNKNSKGQKKKKKLIKQEEPSFVCPIHIYRPRLRCPALSQDPGSYKGGMRGEGRNRQKNKRGRKGTTTHPTNSERPFRSEKPARQSVTLISKSNSTPMQPHIHTHTIPQHPTIRQQSCPRSLLATQHPLPKVPFTA